MTLHSALTGAAAPLTGGAGDLTQHASLLQQLIASGVVPAASVAQPLSTTNDVAQPADAPSRSLIVGAGGRLEAVLFISSGVSPSLMARNVANARGAQTLLGPDLGSVILEPCAEGISQGRSYALWPWHPSLSRFRAWARVQKRLLRPSILAWLCESAAQTRRPVAAVDLEAAYRCPLRALIDSAFSPALRASAEASLARLEAGAWTPHYVLEHGDWWLGNVLLPRTRHDRARHRRGFILIDWAGARLNGYPFFDLLRYGRSAALPPRVLRDQVKWHCDALGCGREDALGYLLAGIGVTAMDLEHFPMDRFRPLSEANYLALSRALL